MMNLHRLKELIRPYYLRNIYFRLLEKNRPAAFTKCWDYDWQLLADHLRQAPDSEAGGAIHFFPMADWHGMMQRSQHLVIAMRNLGNRCYFQSPHLGREYPTSYLSSPKPRISALGSGIYEVHIHLPFEPVYHHRRLSGSEVDRIAETHLRLAELQGCADRLLLVSFPVWAPLARKLKEKLGCEVAYDCHDYFADFPLVATELLEEERELLDISDIVFFSSEWLQQHWLGQLSDLSNRSLVVRNGATPSDFVASVSPRKPGQPVTIGYIGALASWFDVDLVEFLVRARPVWRFRLIGEHASPELKRLAHYPNTELIAPVPYRDLPAFLASFSAGIIPFTISQLTRAVDPVKLYEYLSAGLPVVSTPLPELARFSQLVSVAATPGEFLEQLELAVAGDTPDLRKLRIEAVRQESWAHRAHEMLNAVSEMRESRRRSTP